MNVIATPAISSEDAHGLAARGEAVLLDLRPPPEFARGHAEGALSVPFSPRGLAERVRLALPPGRGVVLIAPDDMVADASSEQLAVAGIAVRGRLAGGTSAWRTSGRPMGSIGEVGVEDLSRLPTGTTIVDVREPIEWATGHVPGALLIRLADLRASLDAVPRGGPVVAICEAGVRSCVAASILAGAGYDVSHVPAGTAGYRRAGLPLEFSRVEGKGA